MSANQASLAGTCPGFTHSPSNAPTTNAPTPSPSNPPTTTSPSSRPTTSSSQQPSTSNPSHAPTTSSPSNSPTTTSPSSSPTTAMPTPNTEPGVEITLPGSVEVSPPGTTTSTSGLFSLRGLQEISLRDA
ncbi:hypothetical protein ACHAXH_007280, partial [Discostella pseudostelligera]